MKVRWSLKRDGDGWAGVIEIPINPAAMPGGGKLTVRADGQATKAHALGKAAAAGALIESQMAAHPTLAALLPPGTAVALHAMNHIAQSAAVGKLEDALAHHTGPAMKRLGKVLGL